MCGCGNVDVRLAVDSCQDPRVNSESSGDSFWLQYVVGRPKTDDFSFPEKQEFVAEAQSPREIVDSEHDCQTGTIHRPDRLQHVELVGYV